LRNRLSYLILLVVVTVLLALSAWKSPIWYDDAGHFLVVRELVMENDPCYPVDLAHGVCDKESAFITMGPALNYPLASWMQLFGISMAVARILMVILSIEALLAFLVLAGGRIAPHKAFWALALVAGNIQLLTYGAEVLGEVPMLGWLFLGLALQLRWLEKGGWLPAVAAPIAFGLAMLTKLYLAAPLALAMGAWMGLMVWRGKSRKVLVIFLQGLLAGGLVLAWQWKQSGSLEGVWLWLQDRGSYQSEFLAYAWGESLRYLLFKPLIWIGTIALIVKVRIKKQPADLFLLCFHGFHLVFFLASAGYDRFGFQLIFIPAIYLAEFVAVGWNRLGTRKKAKIPLKAAFLLLFLLLFSQKTIPILAQRIFVNVPNAAENELQTRITSLKIRQVFTYDQQIAPFLPAGIDVRFPKVVPSNAAACQPLVLQRQEWLIAGPYARTEYPNCIPWPELTAVDSVGEGENRYVLWKKENQ
jgi:hypothetical protein